MKPDRLRTLMPGDQPRMRDRILDEATKAFAEKGYHGTTIREILNACGVSPPAMYNHYKSKEELLYAIHKDAYVEVERLMNQAANGGDPHPEARLRRLVAAFSEFQATHHETAHVIDNNYMHLPEPWRREVTNRRRGFRALFRNAIADGIEEGVFAVPDTHGFHDPALLAAIVIGDYCLRLASWFKTQSALSPKVIGQVYADFAVQMLRPASRLTPRA